MQMQRNDESGPAPEAAEAESGIAADRLADFNRYRGLLFSIAYRMLGSVADAEGRLDDSLSMAFSVLLQRLSPAERAVFLLREVFDYEYGEGWPRCRTAMTRVQCLPHD